MRSLSRALICRTISCVLVSWDGVGVYTLGGAGVGRYTLGGAGVGISTSGRADVGPLTTGRGGVVTTGDVGLFIVPPR